MNVNSDTLLSEPPSSPSSNLKSLSTLLRVVVATVLLYVIFSYIGIEMLLL